MTYQSGIVKINGNNIASYTEPFEVDVLSHPFNPVNYNLRFYYDFDRSKVSGSPYAPYLLYLYYFALPVERLFLDSDSGIYSSPPSLSWNGSVVTIGSGYGHQAGISWNSLRPVKNLGFLRPTTLRTGVIDPLYQVVVWRP